MERFRQHVRAGRLSPRFIVVDALGDERRATIVLGSLRSGTTKLAEVLCAHPRSRLIFEPLNSQHSTLVPGDFRWALFVDPRDERRSLQALWRRVLTGRCRGRWIDSHNSSRMPARRVVKCIAGTNLVSWLPARFPSVPLVYIVRHPFAVAASVDSMVRRSYDLRGWGPHVSEIVDEVVEKSGLLDGPLRALAGPVRDAWHNAKEPFDRIVLRWCLENYVALTSPPPGLRIVFFERFFCDPVTEITNLGRDMGLDLRSAIGEVDTPSGTDFAFESPGKPRTSEARIATWQSTIPEPRIRAGKKLLELFGLDRFYGGEPAPKPGS